MLKNYHPLFSVGYGLFSKRNIDKGEFLAEYAGEVISDEEADKREDQYTDDVNFLYRFRVNGIKLW